MPYKSDSKGTTENEFRIGRLGGGQRIHSFWNGFLGRLLWTPTATRDIVIPDRSGTIALTDGLTPAIAPGQPTTFEQIGSCLLVEPTLIDGTQLTKADHVNRSLRVNGGTILLPANTDWVGGDKFIFTSVGTTPTTISWPGNSIIGYDTGALAAQTIGGAITAVSIIEKQSSGVAYLYSGSNAGINAIAITTGTNPVTPALTASADYNMISAAGLVLQQYYGFSGISGVFLLTGITGNTITLQNVSAAVGATVATGTKIAPTGATGSVDWTAPGTIGSTTQNTGAFTTLTASQKVFGSTLTDGTTLTIADHSGSMLPINGGTINLPTDANFLADREFTFLVVGANATLISWAGNSIINVGVSSGSTQTIAGGAGGVAVIKKGTTGIAYLFSGTSNLDSLTDVVIASPVIDDALRYDGTRFVNKPGIYSVSDTLNRAFLLPAGGTSTTQIGMTATAVGTVAHITRTAGTAYTEATRYGVTSAATAGALASVRSTLQRLWGGNAAGKGGFTISILFGLSVMQVGQRAFFGVDSNGSNPTNVDPLTTTAQSKVGMAINTNTGTWNLINNIAGTAPTVLVLNAGFPVDITTLYELYLSRASNAAGIFYRITNKNTGAAVSGTLTTNIPAAATFVDFYAWSSNNATAAAVTLVLGRVAEEYG
jgi:hypothetical protein